MKSKYPGYKEVKCPNCGKIHKVWLENYSQWYNKYCSRECALQKGLEKRKATCQKKYGTDNVFKVKDIQEKQKATVKEKYGVDNVSCNKKVQEKRKNTFQERYGVNNPGEYLPFQQKQKETFLKKYGVSHFSKSEEYKLSSKERLEKYRRTCMQKWGVESYSQTGEFKKKFRHSRNCYEHLINNPEYSEYKFNFTQEEFENRMNYEELTVTHMPCGTTYPLQYMYGTFIVCPKCRQEFKSVSEEAMFNYIKELGYSCESGNRKVINPYELDIYLPEQKIAIEYNGLMFHNSAPFLVGKKGAIKENSYKVDSGYHHNKTEKALEKGISLYHLWEYKMSVEHRYSFIRGLLGLYNEIIYARNTQLKIINSKSSQEEKELVKEFIEKYHLQGYKKSLIHFVLYHKSEIVSVLSISRTKYPSVLDNSRYTVKWNTKIIGGFQKLMKHFLLWSKNYNFDTLVSFCDRDLSPDPLQTCYYKYGFEYLGDIGNQLSYYLLDSSLLKISLPRGHYFRQYFQKYKLENILNNFDPELTEIENCCNHKIYPIYNSGTHKYILNLKEGNNVI